MYIKQISIFVENKKGRLAEITSFLAGAQINIHALSIADTTDFGILRLIVSDTDKAYQTLKDKGLMVKMTDVIAISLEHKPGSLSGTLKELESHGISIEYMYAFTSRSKEHDAMVILRLNNQEEAVEALKKSNIKILDKSTIESLL